MGMNGSWFKSLHVTPTECKDAVCHYLLYFVLSTVSTSTKGFHSKIRSKKSTKAVIRNSTYLKENSPLDSN